MFLTFIDEVPVLREANLLSSLSQYYLLRSQNLPLWSVYALELLVSILRISLRIWPRFPPTFLPILRSIFFHLFYFFLLVELQVPYEIVAFWGIIQDLGELHTVYENLCWQASMRLFVNISGLGLGSCCIITPLIAKQGQVVIVRWCFLNLFICASSFMKL